jgi:glycosyltransferase involved in cell wall biosynthesis
LADQKEFRMTDKRLASIIINNYNYGRFIQDALDSALGQTYPHKEVIVVDDGSTDDSRAVIRRYDGRIRTLFKKNGGQSSAFNAGFRLSRGRVICFLDADDTLHPRTLEKAMELLRDPRVVKVHWPLWEIDAQGRKTGYRQPAEALAKGDLRQTVLQDGPGQYTTSPSSARAYARSFLEKVFPLPEIEKEIRVGAADWDDYLSMLAPLFGRVERLARPGGGYRIHGSNDYSSKSFADKLQRELRLAEHRYKALSRFCRRLGYPADPAGWREKSWYGQLDRALRVIAASIPAGATLVLIDQDNWETEDRVAGCGRIPFPEQDGMYGGHPPDDAFAIREIERLRRAGADWLVVCWPAFWWLDHYPDFATHIRSRYRVVVENAELIIFDLSTRSPSRRKRQERAHGQKLDLQRR